MSRIANVYVYVHDAAGNPVSGVKFNVYADSNGQTLLRTTTASDSNGWAWFTQYNDDVLNGNELTELVFRPDQSTLPANNSCTPSNNTSVLENLFGTIQTGGSYLATDTIPVGSGINYIQKNGTYNATLFSDSVAGYVQGAGSSYSANMLVFEVASTPGEIIVNKYVDNANYQVNRDPNNVSHILSVTGDPLEGAVFGLAVSTYSSATPITYQGVTYQPGDVIEGIEFTSGADGKASTGAILPPGYYALIEKSAPNGFKKGISDRTDRIDNDYYDPSNRLNPTNPLIQIRPGQTLNVYLTNERDTYTYKFYKYEEGDTSTLLSGASFELTGATAEGVAISPIEFSIDSDPVEQSLVAGTYTLTEKTAPDGYCVGDPLSITIANDGTATITSGNGEVRDSYDILFYDKPTIVELKKTDEDGTLIGGATLQLLDANGDLVEEWETVAGEAYRIEAKLVAGASYTLTETVVPDGYEQAEDVEFTVNEDGSEQTVEMVDAKIVVDTTDEPTTDDGTEETTETTASKKVIQKSTKTRVLIPETGDPLIQNAVASAGFVAALFLAAGSLHKREGESK